MKDNPRRSSTHRLFKSLLLGLPLLFGAVQSLTVSTTCEWKIPVKDKKIPLPPGDGDLLLEEYIEEYFQIENNAIQGKGKTDSDCKHTYVHIQPGPFGTPDQSVKLSEWKLDNIAGLTQAQSKTVFFRLGTETEMAAGFVKAEFVLCGEETLVADGQEHRIDAGKMGTNEFKKVAASTFDKWFVLSNSKDVCDIETYQLFDKAGKEIQAGDKASLAQLTKDFNKFIKQDLLVDLKKTEPDQEFEIQATTIGKKTAKKKLIISVNLDAPDAESTECRFTVAPVKGETVLQYLTAEQLGAENVKRRAAGQDNLVTDTQIGNLAREFFKVFTVGTSDAAKCPATDSDVVFNRFAAVENGLKVNRFVRVAEQSDFVTEIKGPGSIQYLLKVTTKDEFSKACPANNCKPKDMDQAIFSNVIQNDVTVCGKERIEAVDPKPYPKTITSNGVKDTEEIEFSIVESWFRIANLGPGVSESCKVDEYALVVQDPDPYVMLVGYCLKEADGSTGTKSQDFDIVEAASQAECQKKCSDTGKLDTNPSCVAMQWTASENKCAHWKVPVKGFGKASKEFDCLTRVAVSNSNPRFKQLGDLEGYTNYKIAGPSLLSLTLKDNIKIPLKYKVTNEKFFVQARTQGGSTAFKEIDLTVIPYECDGIDAITRFSESDEIISVEKDGSPQQIIEPTEVTAWFKVDTSKKLKKSDCSKLQFKLEKRAGLTGYASADGDSLVSLTPEGQLTITKAEATIAAKLYYVTAFTDGGVSSGKKKTIRIQKSCVYVANKKSSESEVSLAYEEGKVFSLWDQFSQIYTVEHTDGEPACEINRLYTFKTEEDYKKRQSLLDSGELQSDTMTKLKVTMSADTQGKKEYLFAVGSHDNYEYSSPLAKTIITVCGKEAYTTLDEANAHSIEEKKGSGKTKETISKSTYGGWFKFEAGTDSSDKCGVITYRLVDAVCDGAGQGCSDLTSNIYSLDGDNLVVNIDNLKPEVTVAYLEGKTLGGVRAYKKIEAKEQVGPCAYTMSKKNLDVIVLPYAAGTTVNPMVEFQKQTTFTNGGNAQCPVEKVWRYATQAGTTVTTEGAFSNAKSVLDFEMDEAAKGTKTYYYAIGGGAADAKSDVGSASIVVCGKETLTKTTKSVAENADGYLNGSKYILTVKQADAGNKVIPLSTIKEWFVLDTTSDSNAQCAVKDDQYALENASPYATFAATSGITIKIPEVPPAGASFFVEATTQGQVKAKFEVQIKVVLACGPTVDGPDSSTIVLPYIGGKVHKVADLLKTRYKFTTKDPSQCPADLLYLYPSAVDYPDSPSSTDKMSDLTLTLSDQTKINNKYVFALGTSANSEKSGKAIEANIFVCGKETITKGAAQTLTVTKGAQATREIPFSDYQKWFTYEAAPDSLDKDNKVCGKIDYKLQRFASGSYKDLTTEQQALISLGSTPNSPIIIQIDKATEDEQEIFLSATTQGQKQDWISIKIKEANCEITVSKKAGQDQQIVLPYVENQEVVYATELQKEYDFKTSDNSNCKVNKIYVTGQFAKEGAFSKVAFTMNESEKGKKEITFSVGTEGKKAKSAPETTSFIICGMETVTLTNADPIEKVLRTDVNDSIKATTYQTWFKWEAGDKSSAECFKDLKYELVGEDGKSSAAVDELVKINGSNDIEIDNSKLKDDSKTVQLKVTSQGGKSIMQKIELQAKPKCKPIIDPLDATIVINKQADDAVIDIYQAFVKDMGIKTNIAKDCTIDQLLTFTQDSEYPSSGKALALDGLTLKYNDDNKKSHDYKFAVTANGGKDVSKLATAKVVICGKETVTPTTGTAEIRVKKGETYFDIKEDTFSKYFEVGTAADGANGLCTVDRYEIVNDKKEPLNIPLITKGAKASDDIRITIAEAKPEGTEVYLRATTKGGAVSELKKLTVSFECGYKVTETSSYGDGEVIVPFKDGGADFVPFPTDTAAKPFEGAFTFFTEDNTRCPMTHVLLYASEDDYKNNNPKPGMPVLLEKENVAMIADNQGKREYFFAITGVKDSKGEYVRSNLGKVVVYVCGKETISLAQPGKRAIGLKEGADTREISYDDYSKWFEIKAPTDQASTKCGIIKGEKGIQISGNTAFAEEKDKEIKFVDGKGLVIDIKKALDHPTQDFRVQAITLGGQKETQELAISKSCDFKVSPKEARIVLPYENKKVYDLNKQWKDAFPTREAGGGSSQCSFNRIYQYKQPDHYFDHGQEYEFDKPNNLPLGPSDQGKEVYYLAFGNSASEKPSEMVTLTRIVCGKETIKLVKDEPAKILAEREGASDDTYTIEEATYSKWFDIDATGDETDPECAKVKYYVGQKSQSGDWTNGDTLFLDSNDVISGPLKFKKDNRIDNKKVYIKAVTQGQVIGIKEMDISVVINCKFTLKDGVIVDQDAVQTLENHIGGEFNLAEAVTKGYEFEFFAKLCPLDTIWMYEADRETIIKSVPMSELMSDYVPGKNTYYWSVGSSQAKDTDKQRSKIYKTHLAICGLETIKVKSDDQLEFEALRQPQVGLDGKSTGGNNAVYAIGRDQWIDGFEVGFVGDQTDKSCGIHSYEIEGGNGLVTVSEGSQQLLVNVERGKVSDPEVIKLKAITKGGKVATRKIKITTKDVTQDESCIINIVPAKELDFAVKRGCDQKGQSCSEYNFSNFLDEDVSDDKKYTRTYSGGGKKCTIPDFVQLGDSTHHNTEPDQYSMQYTTVQSHTPGTTIYYWKVDNFNKEKVSSQIVSTKVTVCGNEKISAASSDPFTLDLATGFDKITIPNNVLENYFTLDTSAEGSSKKCSIFEYTIPTTAGLEITNDALVITEAQLAAGETTVELKATTLGLEVATQQLKLVKDSSATKKYAVPTCVFNAGKQQVHFGALKDSKINLDEKISLLDVTNGGNGACPMNNVKKYTSKENADSDTDGVEVSRTDFETTADKNQFIYFRVGAQGNTQDYSPVLSLRISVCGDETLKSNPIPRAINFIYKDGESADGQIAHVTPEIYKQYFTSSFPSCAPEKFAIVNDKDEVVSNGVVRLSQEQSLIINLESAGAFHNKLFLQATSIGGIVAKQRLQVTIKPSNNDCAFEASPESIDIVLDYEQGKNVNFVDEMKKLLTLKPVDDQQCQINEMIKYKTKDGKIITNSYGFDIETGERSPNFEITKPMKEEYNVKTGSSSSFRMSGLVQASITVCGDETIEPINKRIKITRKQSKTSKYSIIAPDEYSKWFKLGFDGTSDKCIISNAVVEDSFDNKKISDGSFFINEKTQELMISLENYKTNSIYNLVVTTRGGKKATKEVILDIKKIDDDSFTLPCQYSVNPSEGVIVTQTDVPDMKPEQWQKAFDGIFNIASDDEKECPINQWYKYQTLKDSKGEELKSLESQFNDWTSEFSSEQSPKTKDYYFRVGGKSLKKKSNIFSVTVTKCGAEKISLAQSLAGKEVKTYELGQNIYTAGFFIEMANSKDGFDSWFEVTYNAETNEKCGQLSYSLETKNKGEFIPLKSNKIAEIVVTEKNKYLQINLQTTFTETLYLTATTKGGIKARRELNIESKKVGPPPVLAVTEPQKPCSACAEENLSKICVDTSQKKTTGACCVQGDVSPGCTPGATIKCSPMLLKAQSMFYNYCPMNNEEACEGKNFEAGSSKDQSFANLASVDKDGKPKNDACTYDIKAPANTYKPGAKLIFRLNQLKGMRVYLKIGDDINTAKSIKGRRRLNAVIEDKGLEVNKSYKIDLSQGKLNVMVVPDKGTKPGDTALSWEYRVDGEKLPPPVKPDDKPKEPEKKPEEKPKEPETKPEEKPKEPEKKPEEPKAPVKEEPKEPKTDTPVVAKEEEGIEVILIIVCGVLVVLVLVCCVLYIQYRNKLTQQKQVQQDIEAKLHDAQQGIEKLKNEKPAVTLKAPEEVNQSSVGNDRSRMESQGDARKNLLDSQETPFVKTKDEFDPFTNITADGKKEGKSKAKVDTIVYASVSHEEMTVKAFKDKLWKKAEMTLESLFRICDSSYEQAFSAAHFKEKLESLDLGLSGAEINRLIGIFDEDLSGQITIYEYYSALEAYHVRSDEPSPFDDDPQSLKFIHQSAFRLVKVMRDRSIEPDELFRLIDISGDGIIVLAELKEVLRSFGDFQQKELFAIREYFDLDSDGQIQKQEFFTQLNKASEDYDAYVEKLQQDIDDDEQDEQ